MWVGVVDGRVGWSMGLTLVDGDGLIDRLTSCLSRDTGRCLEHSLALVPMSPVKHISTPSAVTDTCPASACCGTSLCSPPTPYVQVPMYSRHAAPGSTRLLCLLWLRVCPNPHLDQPGRSRCGVLLPECHRAGSPCRACPCRHPWVHLYLRPGRVGPRCKLPADAASGVLCGDRGDGNHPRSASVDCSWPAHWRGRGSAREQRRGTFGRLHCRGCCVGNSTSSNLLIS
jgi:hypothetical protein